MREVRAPRLGDTADPWERKGNDNGFPRLGSPRQTDLVTVPWFLVWVEWQVGLSQPRGSALTEPDLQIVTAGKLTEDPEPLGF